MNFGIDYVLVYLMYSKYVLLSNVFFIPPSLLHYMLYVATTGIGTGGFFLWAIVIKLTFSVPSFLVVAVSFVDICHSMFGFLCGINNTNNNSDGGNTAVVVFGIRGMRWRQKG